MGNWFDASIVLADSIQLICELAAFRGFVLPASLFRIVRLIRLCRLLRVVRAQIFADLLAMIQGIMGSMLTLWWALVLLLIMVYFFALLFNVIIGPMDIRNIPQQGGVWRQTVLGRETVAGSVAYK